MIRKYKNNQEQCCCEQDMLQQKNCRLEEQANNNNKNIEIQQRIQKKINLVLRRNDDKQFLNKLSLRAIRTDHIPLKSVQMLQRCSNLQHLKHLNLSQMGLKIIDRLPKFPSLKFINLTMNFIRDQSVDHLFIYRNLQSLYLSQNLICQKATFDKFKKLPYLKELDLQNNPVMADVLAGQYSQFRRDIFNLLSSLKIFNRFTPTKDLESNEYNMDSSSEEEDFQSEDQRLSLQQSDYYQSQVDQTQIQLKSRLQYFDQYYGIYIICGQDISKTMRLKNSNIKANQVKQSKKFIMDPPVKTRYLS